MQTFKVAEDKVVFQARVYIDGMRLSSRVFREDALWPEVISDIDNHFHGETSLRFPKFHREILNQTDWQAGDELGRIKIVIAEGVMRPDSLTPTLGGVGGPLTFNKLRDVVAFAFQHAPQRSSHLLVR